VRPGDGQVNWLQRDRLFELVNGIKHSLFRLQIHPVYLVQHEQEEFKRFLREGSRTIPPDSALVQRMRAHKDAGRVSQRVYLVHPPINDYQRYVFVHYHESALAGEDLRIIDASQTPDPGLPDFDFMLLDEEIVLKVHYEPGTGAYIGHELLQDVDPTEFMRYRELALGNSVPFLDYERTLPT
jgi:hypothetical protein